MGIVVFTISIINYLYNIYTQYFLNIFIHISIHDLYFWLQHKTNRK